MRISDWSSDVCSSDLSDGRSSRPILGPALDGRPGFAAIRSTPESATWHGDSTWDHAVGPLQFIPSTWSRWAADGDGEDRTSVVEGKSASVRVDPWGRSIIQKKKRKT